MVKRNPHVAKLNSGYIFPEIIKRKNEFIKEHPLASLINLGIGDTTEPLPTFIANELAKTALALGTEEGYSGYGPEEGQYPLRKLIAKEIYEDRFTPEEIFISDGTNCDIGRLQILFGGNAKLAVQNPSYPVYVDTGVILGQTVQYDAPSRKYGGISYMDCVPSNQFFPNLSEMTRSDLIYFCSPNNPTGATATRPQLQELIQFASKHRTIIVYDTAYASYIQDPHLPRSIYEIDGSKEIAIELGSFSKMAGFTGVRLGWSVVPKEMQFEDGSSVNLDWSRVHATFFNGASNISQAGGMAILHSQGLRDIKTRIQFYMENAKILRKVFENLNFEVYGGINAPFLWVKFPKHTSWEAFDLLLKNGHIVSVPGSGFGPSGDGFLRLSAFGKRFQIEEAASRLQAILTQLNEN